MTFGSVAVVGVDLMVEDLDAEGVGEMRLISGTLAAGCSG